MTGAEVHATPQRPSPAATEWIVVQRSNLSEVIELLGDVSPSMNCGAANLEKADTVLRGLLSAAPTPTSCNEHNPSATAATVITRFIKSARALIRANDDATWHGLDVIEICNLQEAVDAAKQAIAVIDGK